VFGALTAICGISAPFREKPCPTGKIERCRKKARSPRPLRTGNSAHQIDGLLIGIGHLERVALGKCFANEGGESVIAGTGPIGRVVDVIEVGIGEKGLVEIRCVE
jgi:hypothetical protein